MTDKKRSRAETPTSTKIDPKSKIVCLEKDVSKLSANLPEYTQENILFIRQTRRQKAEAAQVQSFEISEQSADLKTQRAINSSWTQMPPDEFPMEPFNMNREFKKGDVDSDGNLLRHRKNEIDDAWLSSLEGPGAIDDNSDEDDLEQMDAKTEALEEEINGPSPNLLIRKLIEYLVSETDETPADALKRLKEEKVVMKEVCNVKKTKRHQKMTPSAQATFDEITEICDFLTFSQGVPDILSKKKTELLKLQTVIAATTEDKKSNVEADDELWQFRWKNTQSGQKEKLHGPYKSAEISAWINSGYISELNPVDLREVTAAGEPTDGVWRNWKFLSDGSSGGKAPVDAYIEKELHSKKELSSSDSESERGAQGSDDDDDIDNGT